MRTFRQMLITFSPLHLVGYQSSNANRGFHVRFRAGRFALSICAAALTLFLGSWLLAWASSKLGLALFSAVTTAQAESIAAATRPAGASDSVIVKLADAYRNAVLTGDAPAVLALFRDDATEIPAFQSAVSGRAAIEEFYRKSFASPMKVTAFTFNHTETLAQGDVAYDVGSYKRTMSGGSNAVATSAGGSIELHGMYVVILRRTDGEWKIAYLTYNCDYPPPSELSRK
jgi:uncharacterized protein (TIGR02246 family)